ncbi:MAG: type II toxin-antitoxin system RelE/ParE family toxin [Candidatus Lokiarchaeota archaeon]|nr:type II toxin-antitoxin system RelE/ParE family toxin [Candidatus Lokiarchaeota archaeon]
MEDLSEIKDYIARDSAAYAKIFINKLYDSVQKLVEFPKIGRIVPELNNALIRELLFQNYRIIYRIVDDLVEIISVFHGSRLLRL